MTIALIAAESFELAGFRKRLQNVRQTNLPLRFSYMGEWQKERFICCANGPGFQLAGEATGTVIERFSPDSIWSIGLCGALAEYLRVGDVVTAAEVVDASNGQRFPAMPVTASSNGVTVVSQDRVAATVEEKSRLRALGSVVEMESASVARAAAKRGIQFHCIKAVSDTAREGFSIDLNRARDSAGRFVTGSIVRQAFARPSAGLPELARLFRHSRIAAERLGEFLGNSRV